MGLIVDVLKRGTGGASNGGVSSKVDDVTLVECMGRPVDGPFEPTPERPAVAIVPGNLPGTVKAVPVEQVVEGNRVRGYRLAKPDGSLGPMMGGSFIHTSDARFAEALGEGAGARPVALHDRFETQAQYDALSR